MKKTQGARTRGWLQAAALAAIDVYQVTLRLMNPWGCKFHPSCSHYAREAIELHGPGQGLWLAARRLLRCRPGTQGGFDPVPELIPPVDAESSWALGEERAN